MGKTMKLTVHLFRSDATSFNDLLRVYSEKQQQPERRNPKRNLNVPMEVWILADKKTKPAWVEHVDPLVETSNFENVSNSVAILLQVASRFWAVTFGYGNSMLNHDFLEPEFGLRVSANMLKPDALSTIQVRTLEENSRQQRSHTTNKSRVVDFDLEIEQEWLRYLRGNSDDNDFLIKSGGGSQSLNITTESSILDLSEILEWLFGRFTSHDYRDKFPYIDNFIPIPSSGMPYEDLNKLLIGAIKEPSGERLGVASPDDLFEEEVDHYKISGDGKKNRSNLTELNLEDVLSEIDTSLEGFLEVYKIVPINSQGSAVRTKRKLADYFVYETTHEGSTYVFCLGNWFQISDDYVAEINKRMADIPDITDDISLDTWTHGQTERDYNADIAERNRWLLMDRDDFYLGGPYQKNEVCDLVTSHGELVCVKKMESSATLSHLFSQAAVSAELYYENAEGYRDSLQRKTQEHFGSQVIPQDVPKIVLAIATDKGGDLAEVLFFFSKVNLTQRIPSIKRCGFNPVLAKINR